jgi:PAS domain S-box-containing protein
MMLVDPDGRWVQVNRAACDLLGGSERDLVGRRLSDSSGPSSDVRRGRREAPESRHADVAFPDGSRRTLRYSTTAHLLPGRHLVVLSDIAGGAAGRGSRPEQDAPRLARLAAAVTKHVNAVRRISERREAEDVRRQLASIVESSEDAIIGQTLAGLVFSWNQGAEKMYGYGADEVKGRSLSILGLPAHEHDLAAVLGKVRGGERVVQYETVHVRKDGTPIDVSLTASPLRDEAGRIWGVSSIIRDISDRKRADEGLRKSEEQLRALTGRVESVREEERAHIAREIHDELGQALTALKIDMAALAKKTAGRHTGVHRRIQPMLKAIDDTIESVRRISSQLRPGVLDVLGVVAAIEWQAREFEARTGIGCRFTSQVEDLAVDREQSTTIFRIFQESLTNVARHAQASTVDVVLRTSDGRLTLTVRDNGKGITEAQVRDINSLGLVGMRERALLLGGELSVSGLPGEETTVVLSMPVRRAPDGDRTE